MKFIFIFLDGVGLGQNDPETNPFVRAHLPILDGLTDGIKIIADGHLPEEKRKQGIFNSRRASLLPLDACLGIDGLPQSATGQASLLAGKNVSAMLGSHDGPKPNPKIMEILKQGTLFSKLNYENQGAILVNAYPPRYFKSIESGHRLPGVIALSAIYAGIRLRTMEDLSQGEALSVDFTGRGWRDQLGFPHIPLLDASQAGERLITLSNGCELSFFEYWLTDVAGHQQDMHSACDMLELVDSVLGSMVSMWDEDEGLVLITSDHGNLEDLSTRHHTFNDVPLILIGSPGRREIFIEKLIESRGSREKFDLTDVAPAILSQT